MKAQLALEILLEVKQKDDEMGDTEKKGFKPKYGAERLNDYGKKPDENFCKNLENGKIILRSAHFC